MEGGGDLKKREEGEGRDRDGGEGGEYGIESRDQVDTFAPIFIQYKEIPSSSTTLLLPNCPVYCPEYTVKGKPEEIVS